MKDQYTENKLSIIGGGIIGAMEAYFAYREAQKSGKKQRVTVYEKNKSLAETTTLNMMPSFTPDEILSVVPRGQELVDKLKIIFSDPGGIRVDDVEGVNNSEVSNRFINSVKNYSQDEEGHQDRTRVLLEFGKLSMELWQQIYADADDELREIFHRSNYNPCHEVSADVHELHKGYRIDLLSKIHNAKKEAEMLKLKYNNLGYHSCRLLSPAEVIKIDRSLSDFCEDNTTINHENECVWKDDAIALWRPGGCIDSTVFLPLFYDYLKKVMGKYENKKGLLKNCFQLKFEKEVNGLIAENRGEKSAALIGLRFFGKTKEKINANYKRSEYVFCPGEALGTLKLLGFEEPSYSGFAGPSLFLTIPVSKEVLDKYSDFNHCMEVHQEGVLLAWQARIRDGKIFIGVGGTKAFYGDKRPQKDQEFALNRNILQLNMINSVLPEFVSIALGKDTKKQILSIDDLNQLEESGIAVRWVGVRGVAYDGFPTLGFTYLADRKVTNARCTTHLGSGGVSFAPSAVLASRSAMFSTADDPLIESVLTYADSRKKISGSRLSISTHQ